MITELALVCIVAAWLILLASSALLLRFTAVDHIDHFADLARHLWLLVCEPVHVVHRITFRVRAIVRTLARLLLQ